MVIIWKSIKKTGTQDQSNTIRFQFSENPEPFILEKSAINDIDEISIKDLQEITKLAKLNIVMATHSSDMIQDRWDLTVELQRPK